MVVDFEETAMGRAKQVKPHQVFVGKPLELLDAVKLRQVRIVDNILFRNAQFGHQQLRFPVNADDQLLFGDAFLDFSGAEIFIDRQALPQW